MTREVGQIGPYLNHAPVRLAGDGKLLYVIGQIVPSPEQLKEKRRKARKVRKSPVPPQAILLPTPSADERQAEGAQPGEGQVQVDERQVQTGEEGVESNSALGTTEQDPDDSMEEGQREESPPPLHFEENVAPRGEVRSPFERGNVEEEEEDNEEVDDSMEEETEEAIMEEDSASWVNMVVDVYEVGDKAGEKEQDKGLTFVRRVVVDKYQQV